MYKNDGNKKVIERKKNFFSKIFSPRRKKLSGQKEAQIQFIVPYTPAPCLSSRQVSQTSVVSFGEYFSSNNKNSLTNIPPVGGAEITNNFVEPAPNISNDPITERKLSTSSISNPNNNNLYNNNPEHPYINNNNSYYINSIIVNNKSQSNGESFKRYLKSLARSRKRKTYISVTSTANNTTTTTTTVNPTTKNLQALPNISCISNVSSTFSIPSLSQLS